MLSRLDCAITLWACLLINLQVAVYSLKAPVTCFKCDHVVHASACNTTTKCNIGEVCAVRKFRGPNEEYQSSGCIGEAKCAVNGRFLSATQIVGKRRRLMTVSAYSIQKRQNDILLCEKCCFGDRCNVLDCTTSSTVLLSTAAPVCQDKVSQCSNHVYTDVICQDDTNAITFCQKSCGKCPINGGFSNWLPWSDCSVSCGAFGESFRVRACDSPKPIYNGLPCQGQTMEQRQCNNGLCPVDGHWSAWGQWLPCNTTCGGGTSMRVRSCSNPVPRHGGKPCDNPASFLETKQCNNQSCPVDGNWSAWGQWLPCNATCGGGTSLRVRSCSNPVPRHGGKPCVNPASFLETKQCNNQSCPVDGNWSAWGHWLPCNATCGGGTSMRVRSCSNPVPRHGGKPCVNPASFLETRHCNNQLCPVSTTTYVGSSTTASPVTKLPSTVTTVTFSGSAITLLGQLKTTSTPTPGALSSTPSTSSTVCQDHPLCSDTHMKRTACMDLYIATTFCPKLCQICVSTTTYVGSSTTASPATKLPSTGTTVITTLVGQLQTTSTPTPGAVSSTPLPSSTVCQDHPLCSDTHMKRTACRDLYIATTFCPKLCQLCGQTITPPTCSDLVGQKCNDPLFQHFTCKDPDLIGLCRSTCGKCHP